MIVGPAVETYVLDAGALIALERADDKMIGLVRQVRAGQARMVVPDAVVAQVWRGGAGRQVRVATLLGMAPEKCATLPLDSLAAKRIGNVIGLGGHSDVVDVHVALVAGDYGAAVVTSDRDDIVAVNPDLAEDLVDV